MLIKIVVEKRYGVGQKQTSAFNSLLIHLHRHFFWILPGKSQGAPQGLLHGHPNKCFTKIVISGAPLKYPGLL